MQTFLPYPDFAQSATVLDFRRLGKQRVEAKQIYLALTEPDYGWKSHPIVKAWKGYEIELLRYGSIICGEWINRGYKDTLQPWFWERWAGRYGAQPPWLGNEAFHLSHKSALVRKLPSHYGPLFPNIPNDLPYIWPVT